jgi:hypothetical protein
VIFSVLIILQLPQQAPEFLIPGVMAAFLRVLIPSILSLL